MAHRPGWRACAAAVLLAAVALAMPATCSRRSLQQELVTPMHSRPEIQITSWADNNATAYGLASTLVDAATLTVINASWSGDRQAAGAATFAQTTPLVGWDQVLGPWLADGRTFWGFQPPNHCFQTWGNPGAMIATARINGAPLSSSLTKVTGVASGAPVGAIRAVKLTVFVHPKVAGNLRMRWSFADTAHPTSKSTYNALASSNNTIRFRVNGVDRALTRQNRFVSVNSLYQRTTSSSNNSTYVGDRAGFNRHLDRPGSEILGVEFGGVGYASLYPTYPVLLTPQQIAKVEIIVADLNNQGPIALFLPRQQTIYMEGLRKCTSNATCVGTTNPTYCCGGYCCVNNRKCCGGRECCNAPFSTCIAPRPGAVEECCPSQATCSLDGGKTFFCCPLGQQCIGNGVCRA